MPFRRGQLQYFVTVAEEGQMTRAARRLHIAQPALSQAIAQLESELGLELLQRHARGVSLTAAGEIFLAKARVALEADIDAAATAQSLARAASGTIEVGFVGPPPQLTLPGLFGSFAADHPGVEIRYRELPFPAGHTAGWLAEVDVAVSHRPAPERQVGQQRIRYDRRAVVIPASHPLAQRECLQVADVLDARFVAYHPSVQEAWAAFHSLDDVRGAPPRAFAGTPASTPAEMLVTFAMRQGIATLPAADAAIVAGALRGVAALPLPDAEPFEITLSWRRDNHNPLVHGLAALAANLEQLHTHVTPNGDAPVP